jgi:hypothetical protein
VALLAQSALPSTITGVDLANSNYDGATYFSVAGAISNNDSGNGNGISGGSSQPWTLTNDGLVTGVNDEAGRASWIYMWRSSRRAA